MLRINQSAIGDYQSCQRKYRIAHVDRMVPVSTSRALGIGRVWALAKQAWRTGGQQAAVAMLIEHAADISEEDAAKLAAMLGHYTPPAGYTVESTELPIEMPIKDGARRLRGVLYFGRLDATLRDADQQLVLGEDKTTSDQILGYGPYWQRLALDHQIAWYSAAIGARRVLYDVARKPGLKLCDKDAKAGAVVGVSALDAYQARLSAEISAEPESYYQQRLVTLTEDQINEALQDLALLATQIRDSTRKGVWPRNPHACRGLYGSCQYLDVCTGSAQLDDPSLFRQREETI